MISRERVRRAIDRTGPDRVPILYFNADKEQSDIILIDVVRHFAGADGLTSEWGFRWDKRDLTMGQPRERIIKKWDDWESFCPPDAFDKKRFEQVSAVKESYGKDRYYLASLVLSGFTVMTFLRGFASTLEDFYINRALIEKLSDTIFTFEKNVIEQCADYGFDGVAFYDDWGTQTSLIISPELWRHFFKPQYKRQFDLARRKGLDVYFHSCGYIMDIIPDLIDIGVDMLNVSQPNLYDIQELGHNLGGTTCFVLPVSYQTTSISGTKEDIYEAVEKMVTHLGSYDGGLIGYVEAYESIGMSPENYSHCIDAFKTLGCYDTTRRT